MKRLTLLYFALFLVACTGESHADRTERLSMSHTPMTGVVDVYCVGDGNTFGESIEAPAIGNKNAYRLALNAQLDADRVAGSIPAGLTFSWVGNTVSGAAPTDHHDGIAGATTVSQFATVLQLQTPTLVPDSQVVVIVPIGNNDALTGPLTAAFAQNYLSLVRRLHNLLRAKHPRFLFNTIIGESANVATINALLPDLWFELTREGIEYETSSWEYPGYDVAPKLIQYNQLANLGPTGMNLWEPFRRLVGYPVTPTWTDLVGQMFGESTTTDPNGYNAFQICMQTNGAFRMITLGGAPVWTARSSMPWCRNSGYTGTTFDELMADMVADTSDWSSTTDVFLMTGLNEAGTYNYFLPGVLAASQAKFVAIMNYIQARTPRAVRRWVITPNLVTSLDIGPRVDLWNSQLQAVTTGQGGGWGFINLMAGPYALDASNIKPDKVHPTNSLAWTVTPPLPLSGYDKIGFTIALAYGFTPPA